MFPSSDASILEPKSGVTVRYRSVIFGGRTEVVLDRDDIRSITVRLGQLGIRPHRIMTLLCGIQLRAERLFRLSSTAVSRQST